MGVCVETNQDGFIYVTQTSPELCQSFVMIDSVQYQTLVTYEVSPIEIAEAFTWGFGAVVVVGYFSGYVIGIAKKLVNKI